MTNLTISISDELANRIKKYKWVNWSQVCREAIKKRIEQLEKVNWK